MYAKIVKIWVRPEDGFIEACAYTEYGAETQPPQPDEPNVVYVADFDPANVGKAYFVNGQIEIRETEPTE